MQSQNISSSSISDASEIRYQKAVREISKLIGLNNTLKRDADNFRAMCQNLQIQNKELFQRYQGLVNEKKGFEDQIKKYELAIRQYESKIENSRQHESELVANKLMDERTKQNEASAILNQKLNQQGNTIMSLEENVAQLQSVIKDLKLNNDKLQSQLYEKQEHKSKTYSNLECSRCLDLKQKIQNEIEYRIKLEKEIIDIKKYQQPVLAIDTVPVSQRSPKDYLLNICNQRMRFFEDQSKRKGIETNKLKEKLEKLEMQLSKYKARQKLFETTAMQQEALQR